VVKSVPESSSLDDGDIRTEDRNSHSHGKVLVVDDEKDIADLYTEWLSDEYDVRTAYNGDEAIQKYDEDIDVALLDRQMPMISGDELLEDIRRLPGDCMAAMVTAVEPEYDILSMEFEDYVQKPIMRDELIDVTESLLTLSEYDDRVRRSFELASKSAALNLDELAKVANKGDPQKQSLLDGLLDTVLSVCSPPLVAVWDYGDGQSPELYEYSGTHEDDFTDEVLSLTETMVWKTYSHSSDQMEFGRKELPEKLPSSVGYCLTNRVGRHAVVLTFLSSEDSITDSQEAAIRSGTAMVGSSLDSKMNRERAEEHETLSDEYKRRTEKLEDINQMMREASTNVLQAMTRTEIQQAACRSLASSPFVEFAWMGEYLKSGDRMVCKYSTDEGFMSSMEESGGTEDAKKVAETKEPRILEDLTDRPPIEPWREQALMHGFSSVVRVPISHNSSFHGVLSVYLNGELDLTRYLQDTLNEIATTVGHAINSYEAKTSLVSNEVTELTLRVYDEDFPPVRFASMVGGTVSLEGVSTSGEDPQKTYITVESESEGIKDRVKTATEGLPSVASCVHISNRGEEEAFRVTGDPFYFQRILNQGGNPVGMSATEKEATLTVHLPKYASTKSFVSMLEKEYDDLKLVSTQSREKEYETKTEFEEVLDGNLTERQMEIVQTAYYSGYFSSPRESTGQEIADQLGVTQPTVTESLKTAEKKVFGLLFDGDPLGSQGSLR